jgi:predicted membrane protein
MAEIKVLEEASEIGLAVMLSGLIRQNLEQNSEKIKHFNALNAKVLIEARDAQIIVGLEFKQGKLTVSKGFSTKPDLHIITDSATVLDLCLVKIKFGLPCFFDPNGFKVLKKLLARQLIIEGLLNHFFLLVRLTKIVSVIRS